MAQHKKQQFGTRKRAGRRLETVRRVGSISGRVFASLVLATGGSMATPGTAQGNLMVEQAPVVAVIEQNATSKMAVSEILHEQQVKYHSQVAMVDMEDLQMQQLERVPIHQYFVDTVQEHVALASCHTANLEINDHLFEEHGQVSQADWYLATGAIQEHMTLASCHTANLVLNDYLFEEREQEKQVQWGPVASHNILADSLLSFGDVNLVGNHFDLVDVGQIDCPVESKVSRGTNDSLGIADWVVDVVDDVANHLGGAIAGYGFARLMGRDRKKNNPTSLGAIGSEDTDSHGPIYFIQRPDGSIKVG